MATTDVNLDEVLLEELSPGIVLITMNRPKKLNSMTFDSVVDMHRKLDVLARDPSCRVVIITGAGRGFSSGHELSEFGDEWTPQEGLRVQEAFTDLIYRIRSLPQPVIAAVNGPATGGGLGVALAADTRICSESALFNAAFVRLGLTGCDVGVSYFLPKLISPTVAFELMLTGRLVDAVEAEKLGLVLRMVSDGEVVPAAHKLAQQIAVNSPFGVAMTKRVMWTNLDAPGLEPAIELENRTQILCSTTRDFREAVAAWREKRPPIFVNA